MKLYNSFAGGVMNKDIEIRLMPKSIYLDAKNIRIFTPDSNNSRSVKFPLGNTVKSALSLGTNALCIGDCIDPFRNLIYWAVKSDSGSYVCEYNVAAETETIILTDTSINVLNFQVGGYVEMRILNDNDNGRNFLVLTDGVNEPKYVETEFAKTLTVNSFTLDDVGLIKAPPTTAPTIALGATASGNENNIESKFLSFAYRYKYTYGEYSAMSSFSEFAFMPSAFSYDYGSGTNNAMFNNFSKVTISFDTGGSNITDVEIIVKESGSNTAFIVETLNKADRSYSDDATETLDFSNSKILRALSSDQLSRVYDNVPTKAGTLEIIGNRIIFGNYTEGYDLEYSSAAIIPSFTLGYSATAGTSGVAHEQVKSNRDYEVAISYTDGVGRFTTPITSEGNTVYVQNSDAINKNVLQVTMDANVRPPDWATGYRFYIKQSKVDYDVIAPITFYRDGVNAWLLLAGNDVNKVAEGDFIYVKSDTSGLKSGVIRTKVLEIKTQVRNFLEVEPNLSSATTFQHSGTYMRLQVSGYNLSETAVSTYESSGYYAFRSKSTDNNINQSGIGTYMEAIYYSGSGLDDATVSGTYSGTDDIRYEIEIDGISPDTFKWREVNVSTGVTGSYTSLVTITTSAQALSNGVSITFAASTGHSSGDVWIISAKSETRANEFDNDTGTAGGIGYKAQLNYMGKDVGDEGVKSGAIIVLTYDDTASASGVKNKQGFVEITLTSSADYPNLEEWFFGDNIITQVTALVADITEVMFRRGTFTTKPNGEEVDMSATPANDPMIMIFASPAYWDTGSSSEIRVDHSFIITEFDNNTLFETIPVDTNTDVFYELPVTYPITSNNHYGNGGSDVNQNFGVTAAVLNLDFFNSFGWYNGFESIKIGDTFNEKAMILDTKPSTPIADYKAITRIASLTYSGVYEATTQFNALNEFNLSTANFKDLDTKYGAIKKLWSKDTNLLTFQQDKTHHVLFNKSVLFNSDGTGNLTQSSHVLGQEVAFAGEYGIGNHPESFAIYGTRIWHIASDSGALMRLSTDGYTEVSEKGMKDYFRTLTAQTNHVGGYDPYNDEYLINVAPDGSPLTLAFVEGAEAGFTSFYEFEPERLVNINNRLYSIKAGQIWLHDDNSTRNNFYGSQKTASITTVLNDSPIEVKHWKSLNLETDIVWDATLTTNFANGTIATTEWVLEEQEYYAYIRQNETANTSGLSTYQGLGSIDSIATLTLTMGFALPRNLAIGDVIYEVIAEAPVVRGTVTALNVLAGTITLDSVADLTAGDFIVYAKNARVEGESIKGHYLQLNLTSSDTGDNELFAVKAEAVRSFD